MDCPLLSPSISLLPSASSPVSSPDNVLGALQGVIGRRHQSTAQSRQLKQTLPTLSIVLELILLKVLWSTGNSFCQSSVTSAIQILFLTLFLARSTTVSPLFVWLSSACPFTGPQNSYCDWRVFGKDRISNGKDKKCKKFIFCWIIWLLKRQTKGWIYWTELILKFKILLVLTCFWSPIILSFKTTI